TQTYRVSPQALGATQSGFFELDGLRAPAGRYSRCHVVRHHEVGPIFGQPSSEQPIEESNGAPFLLAHGFVSEKFPEFFPNGESAVLEIVKKSPLEVAPFMIVEGLGLDELCQ